MGKILKLFFLLFVGVSLSFAQGVRKDDVANSNVGGYVVVSPFASIRVCQNGAIGLPCTPLAQIYSNSALTNALPNPFTADANGNYFFYAFPGTYVIQSTNTTGTFSQPDQTLPNLPSVVTTTFNYISVPFSSTPVFSFSPNTMFKMVLTGNVTSSTLTGVPVAGATTMFSVCEDVFGGHSFSFPANFLTPTGFTLNSTSGACNNVLFTFDGTNWQGIGGGGSGSPAGNNGDVQGNNNGVFGALHINDNGIVINHKEDSQFIGPNPYVDVRDYGVRYVSPGTVGVTTGITATINASSNSATLSAAGPYVNGDGVAIWGAGPAITMSTPAAPTVTPSVASGPTGSGMVVTASPSSTTRCYKIVARDKGQGLTAASPEVCTTTGNTNGSQSVSITSASRSGSVTTYTTSSPHGLVPGAMVGIFGTSNDIQFGGWQIVSG